MAKARCIHGHIWFKPCEECDSAENMLMLDYELKKHAVAPPLLTPFPASVADSQSGLSIRFVKQWDIEV